MKQLIQDLSSGVTSLEEVPAPFARKRTLLIQTTTSLVSAGTERMLVEFGKGNLIQKARQQPDKVREALDKVRTDGAVATYEAIKNKLDTPLPLGYCNVGIVKEIGKGVASYQLGQRVVSNGPHAEYVSVPVNLCAPVPDGVTDEEAAFTVLGAIALQGIRLVQPTLGEAVVVTGLGLVGLLTVQLLRAHGCRVLGFDFDPARVDLARSFGAEAHVLGQGVNPVAVAQQFSRGRGVDAVLITASTASNEPVHQAANMCRKRGRIVLVGVVGLELSRADFYEKELSFQVSCSYGPGRYDSKYEEGGQDYPVGFVRWTEQRNFEAVLDMMAEGRMDVRPLISHRFPLLEAEEAYRVLYEESPLGILLQYPHVSGDEEAVRTVPVTAAGSLDGPPLSAPRLGFVGAGNYASSVLVPAFAATPARLQRIASAGGLSAVQVARRNRIAEATTDAAALFVAEDVDALVITTRHDSHASMVRKALLAGKHVFVEKPLALTLSELQSIEATWQELPPEGRPLLMVGFNRRYAPHVQALKKALQARAAPATMVMKVNAGHIPADHWTQDSQVGGGRLIGEGCHFVDLLRFLAGAPIVRHQGIAMTTEGPRDTWLLQLEFANGSIGTVHYFANGNKRLAKERLEVSCGGGVASLDNFRGLNSLGWSGLKSQRSWRQDKGQQACTQAFVKALQSGDASALIPAAELFEVARVCIEAAEAMAGR